jgi:hypothetical protein
MGRVYVYLMDDSKPICFWKGKAVNFVNPNPVMQWIPLKADLSVGSVKEDWMAGMISLKLSINNATTNGHIDYMQ